MLVKYTYPVSSTLRATERWPIQIERFNVQLGESNGIINSISVQLPMPDSAVLPRIVESGDPKVSLHINVGNSTVSEEVIQCLITIQGIINLFAGFEIDLSDGTVEWVPENDEEKSKLKVFSYNVKKEKPLEYSSPRIMFDLIARAILTAPHASHYEVPLSFIRRGMQDIREDRYIEAFYNFFFFLETLFAPGYSSPKAVEKKFLDSQVLMDAVRQMRQEINPADHRDARHLKLLLSMSDVELVRHLIHTRGNLHHHALHRPDVWHPEKSSEYLSQAIVVQKIAHLIAMSETLSLMYAPARDDALVQSAKTAGAEITLRAEIMHGEKSARLAPLDLIFPGSRPSYRLINVAHRELRKALRSSRPAVQPASFRLLSHDGKEVYATYERLKPPKSD